MRTKIWFGLLAGTAVAALCTTSASADFIGLKVTSGSAAAQNTSLTFSGTTATLNLAGSINGVTYSDKSSADLVPGRVGLDVATTSTNTNNNRKTVTYSLTVTGLAADPNIQDYSELFTGLNPFSSSNGLTSSVTKIYIDNHDVAFGTQNLIYDSSVLSASCGGAASFSCSTTNPISLLTTPFSITEKVTVTYKNGSQNQTVVTGSSFAAIPEPTSLALFGSGLLFAGWMFRRRSKSSASQKAA